MARVEWTRGALFQLRSIREYIRRFDPRAAERMAKRLVEAAESLVDFPDRGRPAGEGYRELPSIAPYVILYETMGDVVFILDIRHGARQRE
jgi:addiction module RelE/StbE family toxin